MPAAKVEDLEPGACQQTLAGVPVVAIQGAEVIQVTVDPGEERRGAGVGGQGGQASGPEPGQSDGGELVDPRVDDLLRVGPHGGHAVKRQIQLGLLADQHPVVRHRPHPATARSIDRGVFSPRGCPGGRTDGPRRALRAR